MRLLLITFVLAACSAGPTAADNVGSSGTQAPDSDRATPARTASPTPTIAIRATLAALPTDLTYIATGWAGQRILWLVDHTRSTYPLQIASWKLPPGPNWEELGEQFSASADGRLLLLSATGPAGGAAIYAFWPLAGSLDLIYEDPSSHAVSPRLAPDGSRYAFLRLFKPGAGTVTPQGIWAADVARPLPRQVADAELPLAWSSDGEWLAVRRRAGGELHVGAVHLGAGDLRDTRDVGLGEQVDWHPAELRLLVTARHASTGKSEIASYDVATRVRRTLVGPSDSGFARALWHPSGARFAYMENVKVPGDLGMVAVSLVDGAAHRVVSRHRFLVDLWWSADGSKLLGLFGGDDSTHAIRDVLGAGFATRVCLRGGQPPDPCT